MQWQVLRQNGKCPSISNLQNGRKEARRRIEKARKGQKKSKGEEGESTPEVEQGRQRNEDKEQTWTRNARESGRERMKV